MTSGNWKRFAASGGITTLVLASLLFLASGRTVNARSEGDESQQGLQGTWRLQVTVRDCQTGQALRTFPALFTFDKGGMATVTTAGQSPAVATDAVGVWKHLNGHTYSAVTEAFIFSPAGVFIQVHRLTRNIEIENDSNRFTDTINLQIFDTTGNQIATGCATSVATRFVIE